jgi:hypothetical protein
MIFHCYSELCQITEDCECRSDCCQGYTIRPLIIYYQNDSLVTTNTNQKTTNEHLIEELVYHHQCPFCIAYVEA